MKLRKISCVSLLFAFTWLWTYQLCDASEDAIESLDARAEIAAQKHVSLRAPLPPDNDPDVLLAPIVDNALMPNHTALSAPVSQRITLHLQQALSPQTVVSLSEKNLSPPSRRIVFICCIGHSNDLFVSSIQSQAPPLA